MSACNARPPEGHPWHGSSAACHIAAGHEGPHTWETEPSNARRGLDRLLAAMAHREIRLIDSQPERPLIATNVETGEEKEITRFPAGPWVLVDFEGGDSYAIWKLTGAVYRVGEDGAVDEDPML